MLNRLRRNQHGDTIVEVMIVLAVLGLAIGIAYSTANRSLLNARQAQENSEATAVAQAQMEQLVSIGCTSGNPACATDNPLDEYLKNHTQDASFCIVSGQVKPSTDPSCPHPLPGSKVAITCLGATPASCPAPRVFEVTVSWDDILGQGRDTVTQDYTLPLMSPGVGIVGGGGGGGVVSCPAGQVGTPPDCISASCPAGQVGTPPDCISASCPAGQTGTPPDCGTCPWYESGTYPDCHGISL